MKTKVIWALVALNALLLAALVFPFGTATPAKAQVGGGRPSEYIMIPGEVVGGSNAVVYIIDTSNQQLSAMTLDPNGRGLDTMPPIDLNRVFARK